MEFKTKDDIKRKHLNYSMLRRVIIRADFTSMINTERMVADLNDQSWFNTAFNNYSRLKYVDTPQPQGINQKEEWQPGFIRRFDDCNIKPENRVTLDITNESLCLDIQCDENYQRIDDYLDFTVNTLAFILGHDQYVKMRRLAIRKIDGDSFPNGNEADNVFEYFDQKISDLKNDHYWQRVYMDNFIYGKTNVKVNYTRTVKVTSREAERFVFSLDIDTYLDSELISNERPSLEELRVIFFERLNEATFELFKRGVKFEFLLSKIKTDESK